MITVRKHNMMFQFVLKSLNHRFINIDIKLPDLLLQLENLIRQRIISNISRGSVQVIISVSGQNEFESFLDIRRVKRIINYLKKNGINVSCVSLTDIIALTNQNKSTIPKLDNTLKSFILRTVENLIKDVIKQKEKEGIKMGNAIVSLLGNIARLSKEIEKIIPKIEMEKQKMLVDKLNEFDNKLKLKKRYTELKKIVIATFLQRSFFEEIKRLNIHLQRFKKQLSRDTNAKELDFLSQEMHKEITTLLNKAEDVRISYLGVKIKRYIEDIREILNNIE